ncbi:MAG TPA: GAF domain-containing protein [Acidobacteriota bacterium]|nr:GAF domain-containing protein [Acidobacteriota bacterium]
MENRHIWIEDDLLFRFRNVFNGAARLDPKTTLDGKEEKSAHILLISEKSLRTMEESIARWANNAAVNLIVFSSRPFEKSTLHPSNSSLIFQILPFEVNAEFLRNIVERSFEDIVLPQERKSMKENLAMSYREIRRLTRVGQYLATERDFDTLIHLILKEARELVGADAGSIYVTERKRGEKPKFLRFMKSKMKLEGKDILLPIDSNSIAGYVAMTGKPLAIENVYALTGTEEYGFNYEYDKQNNYYTKSMLAIPMKNHRDEVIGVIQLINKKRDPEKQLLTIDEMKGSEVIPFTRKCLELTSAFAGQAAVAIERNELRLLMSLIFEGLASKNVQQREPKNTRFFKSLCSHLEGVYERSTVDAVEIEHFAFRLGKRPVLIHYRFEKKEIEALEIRIRLRQKFWLLLNRQKSIREKDDEIFSDVKWLDDSYVIQSNQPEAAKDFLQRLSVQKHLRNFPCSFDKLEIVRGEICMMLYEPSLWKMNHSHFNSLIMELKQIVEEYEQHEIIVLRVFPISAISHCPYCRNSFDQPSDMLLCCKNCHTQIHESCWNENGQCTTWGCLSATAIPV